MTDKYPHIPAEHVAEYDAKLRKYWEVIDRLYRDYPLCGACGHPMVAGQVGAHLNCREPQDNPSNPPKGTP